MSQEYSDSRRLDYLTPSIVLFFTVLVILAHYLVLKPANKTTDYSIESAGPALIAALDAGWRPGPPPVRHSTEDGKQ